MAQEQTGIRERQKTRLKEPGRYVVMMFNDDFTPMDFVVISSKPSSLSRRQRQRLSCSRCITRRKPWWDSTVMT